MKRIKDKDTEILESELTIVGFIFIFAIIVGQMFMYSKTLNKELIEAKSLAIEYYESDKLSREMVLSLNEEIDKNYEEIKGLQSELEQYKFLEKLQKDLR